MYADYIFPDTTYLERWEWQGSHPSVAQLIEQVRNPAIDPLVPDVTVLGEQTPMPIEALLSASSASSSWASPSAFRPTARCDPTSGEAGPRA
jgi:hypothetical protein